MRIFIGYDPKEAVAFHVLSHSILSRASGPVSITPLVQSSLRKAGIYTRERGPLESTEFSLTRFLVPYLCNYEGTAIYMDCDMLCLTDITELEAHAALSVCKHEYEPRTLKKMDGQEQTSYPRKNWSSLMVFDNHACSSLTPSYVNQASPLDLHRLVWADGILPLNWAWNWLIGEYGDYQDAKILHYTLGGPWIPGYENCSRAEDWFKERDSALCPTSLQKQATY